jgi:flagellar hook-associated protein 3 FlgL
MRITNNMLINNMINYIGKNLNSMNKYQYQLATGKKISVPSDDPVVAARALKLRTDVAEIEQHQRNVKDAQSWMDLTESTLANIGDVLQRAREQAVQASNSSNAPDDLEKIKEEISQLKNQLVHLANTTYAGRYIFSGYETDKPLVDETTGNYLINVSKNETIKYEIGIGDDINVNVTGGDLFSNGMNAVTSDIPPTAGVTTGDGSIVSFPLTIAVADDNLKLNIDGEEISINLTDGVSDKVYNDINELTADLQLLINDATSTAADITVGNSGDMLVFSSGTLGTDSFIKIDSSSSAASALGLSTTTRQDGTPLIPAKPKMLKDIEDFEQALESGDYQAVNEILGKLDEDIQNVLRIRADVGARQNRLELTANRLDNNNINFTRLMSENEDVDMAETLIKLQNEENVYQASLAGGARIIMPTLIDFLR